MKLFAILTIAGALLCGGPAAYSQSGPTDPPQFQCSIAGFTTVDYGQGSGWINPMVAYYGMDAANCEVTIKLSTFSCCNTYFQEFYLMFGDAPLFPGLALPEDIFWMGSELLIIPDGVFGPISGQTGSIAVPNNPALPGMTVYLQALGVWTTFFVSYDYGVSQATAITFN